MAVNEALADSPQLLNDSPFDEGWLVEIQCSDVGQLEDLMSADKYASFVAEVSK